MVWAGAVIRGRVSVAVEYRMRARQDLEELFDDHASYANAQALMALSYLDSRLGEDLIRNSSLSLHLHKPLRVNQSHIML